MIRSASSRLVSTQPVRAVRSPSQISSKSSPKKRWSWQTLQTSGRRVGAQDPLRVGDHRHDLLADRVRVGQDVDRVPDRLRHLAHAVRAEDDGRLGEHRLGFGERVAVARVERADDLARQLEVRGLVLADRHQRRLVDDDVAGLQDRVRQQPVVDVVRLALLLLLVCRRPLQPADRRDRGEQPGELGVLGPVALDEQRAALGVEAEREEARGHVARARAKQVRLVGARQRVVVDDAVDRLVLVLQAHVVADRTELVPEVDHARRLDGEDARARRAGLQGSRCRRKASIVIAAGYHSR